MNNKTVVISIGHGLVARNLLRTDFLAILKKIPGIRIILLSPAAESREFQQEFAADNVNVEKLNLGKRRNIRENIFNILHSHLVFTETSHIKLMDRIQQNPFVCIKYFLRLCGAKIFGGICWIRTLLSLLDRLILPDTVNKEIFYKYQPDLVFVTSLMFRHDFDVLKRALANNIKTIGMVKSWDNLVKDIPLRVRPHKLIVWNEIMKDQAIKYQLFDKNKIIVTGIPQFDFYEHKEKFRDKKTFIEELGGDPGKKIILFAGCGKSTPNDPDIVKMLDGFISDEILGESCQVLVRPHFAWKNFIRPLTDLAYLKNILVDNKWNESESFQEGWDPGVDDIYRLAETLFHADIVITSFSTIAIDAIYFDKPIINIAFDGFENKPENESMAKWYGTRYYKDVLSYEATVVVKNKNQLREAIIKLLHDSGYKSENRKRMKRKFCFLDDGMASQRMAKYVIQELEN